MHNINNYVLAEDVYKTNEEQEIEVAVDQIDNDCTSTNQNDLRNRVLMLENENKLIWERIENVEREYFK